MQVWAKGKVVLGFLFLTQDRKQEKKDLGTWNLGLLATRMEVLSLSSGRGHGWRMHWEPWKSPVPGLQKCEHNKFTQIRRDKTIYGLMKKGELKQAVAGSGLGTVLPPFGTSSTLYQYCPKIWTLKGF